MNTLGYGKVAQTAISAFSHLAVNYDEGETVYNSMQIAEARNLPRPLVAKVLSQLAQTNLVSGTAGRNGGYALAVPPENVSFFDVVVLFEKIGEKPFCPFGPGWCQKNEHCAVHDEIEALHRSVLTFLKESNFGDLENPDGETS